MPSGLRWWPPDKRDTFLLAPPLLMTPEPSCVSSTDESASSFASWTVILPCKMLWSSSSSPPSTIRFMADTDPPETPALSAASATS